MAAKKIDKAGDAAKQLREHPIVGRLLEDAELRENIRSAYESSRTAYARLSSSKVPTKALLEDKKLQKELRKTADSLRDVGDALRAPSKRRRGGGLGKLIVVTFVGAVAAVALSEGLRSKVLDLLFGAEEEFDYSSTTAPATPPPAAETPVAPEPVATAKTVEREVPDIAAESTDEVEADSEATTTSS